MRLAIEAPFILNLYTRRRLVVRLRFGRFFPGQNIPVPLNKIFFEPNCWYLQFGEEKNNNERRTWKEAVVTSIEANNLEMFPDYGKPCKLLSKQAVLEPRFEERISRIHGKGTSRCTSAFSSY